MSVGHLALSCLRHSSFSIYLCFEALIKFRSWAPVQHRNDREEYFRIERGCSPLHREHVISLSLYDGRVGDSTMAGKVWNGKSTMLMCHSEDTCEGEKEGKGRKERRSGTWRRHVAHEQNERIPLGTCPVSSLEQRWAFPGSGWTSRWARSSAPPATSSLGVSPGREGTVAQNLGRRFQQWSHTFVATQPLKPQKHINNNPNLRGDKYILDKQYWCSAPIRG